MDEISGTWTAGFPARTNDDEPIIGINGEPIVVESKFEKLGYYQVGQKGISPL